MRPEAASPSLGGGHSLGGGANGSHGMGGGGGLHGGGSTGRQRGVRPFLGTVGVAQAHPQGCLLHCCYTASASCCMLGWQTCLH
jgi:hypothetical protein